MATKYITEVLKEINNDPSLLKTTYKPIGDGGPLGTLFRHAFMAQHKFILPDGTPPFKPDAGPMGMTPGNFMKEMRRLYVFCSPTVGKARREQLFIQMIEGVHPDEAKILIAVKDQKLTELYPKITRTVLADAGFIPPLTPEEAAAEAAMIKKSVKTSAPRKSASRQSTQ